MNSKLIVLAFVFVVAAVASLVFYTLNDSLGFTPNGPSPERSQTVNSSTVHDGTAKSDFTDSHSPPTRFHSEEDLRALVKYLKGQNSSIEFIRSTLSGAIREYQKDRRDAILRDPNTGLAYPVVTMEMQKALRDLGVEERTLSFQLLGADSMATGADRERMFGAASDETMVALFPISQKYGRLRHEITTGNTSQDDRSAQLALVHLQHWEALDEVLDPSELNEVELRQSQHGRSLLAFLNQSELTLEDDDLRRLLDLGRMELGLNATFGRMEQLSNQLDIDAAYRSQLGDDLYQQFLEIRSSSFTRFARGMENAGASLNSSQKLDLWALGQQAMNQIRHIDSLPDLEDNERLHLYRNLLEDGQASVLEVGGNELWRTLTKNNTIPWIVNLEYRLGIRPPPR